MPLIATLNSLADYDGMTWFYDVSLEAGAIESVLAWCKKMPDDSWRWYLLAPSATRVKGLYRFFFREERDYLMFVISWS